MILPISGLTQSEMTDSSDRASRNILVVGDSISAAYGMNIEDGWVARLDTKLQQDGHPYTIVNASITGDTTSSGIARIAPLLEKHLPSIVIIELGGNDGLRGQPPQLIKDNLSAMISHSLNLGAKVLLAEMKIPPNYGIRYTEAFTAIYANLAKENPGVVLLPFLLEEVAINPALMQSDGIHPNANAQPKIAEHVWQTLKQLL